MEETFPELKPVILANVSINQRWMVLDKDDKHLLGYAELKTHRWDVWLEIQDVRGNVLWKTYIDWEKVLGCVNTIDCILPYMRGELACQYWILDEATD